MHTGADADQVVFTCADGVLPEVAVGPKDRRSSGYPASGVDFGVAGEAFEPVAPGPSEAVVVVLWSCVLPGSPGAGTGEAHLHRVRRSGPAGAPG